MADKFLTVEKALSLTNDLRSNVTRVFQDLVSQRATSTAGQASDTVKPPVVAQILKQNLGCVQNTLSDLEKTSSEIKRPDTSVGVLGNSGLLSLDPVEDKTPLYNQLLQTYNWNERVRVQAGEVLSCLKRQHPESAVQETGVKRQRAQIGSVKEELTKTIQFLRVTYNKLEYVVTHLNGVNILQVTVPRTMRVVIVLRGMGVDWTSVRSIQEEPLANLQEELWKQSRLLVFQKITDYANAASLSYYSESDPSAQLKGLVKWINSYQKLFVQKCIKCNKYFKEDSSRSLFPPCWRSYDTLDPLHFQCTL